MFVLEVLEHKFRGKENTIAIYICLGGMQISYQWARKKTGVIEHLVQNLAEKFLEPQRFLQIPLTFINTHSFCFFHTVKAEYLQLYLKAL